MQVGELKQDEKDLVWRYVHCAALWRRKRHRTFAGLESDLRAGYEVVVDGIAVGEQSGEPIILSDAKDPEFFAAIFKNDNSAIPEVRALDLERLRGYIISGVLAKTRPDSRCWLFDRAEPVIHSQAAISFSFARGSASRKVCIGVLPKHQRP